MGTATMRQTTLNVNMMEETVAFQEYIIPSIQIIALNVFAILRKFVLTPLNIPFLGLEMVFAMINTTSLNAIMMGEIVADCAPIQIIAQSCPTSYLNFFG